MTAVHFRYAWISQHRLRQLFPVSPELERISALLLGRHAILARCVHMDCLRAAADDLVRWVERPRWSERPTQRRLRQARHRIASSSDGATNELLSWIDQVLALLNRSPEAELTSQRIALLGNLAQTDFPTLLLWRNPQLAKRLFCDEGFGVALRSQIAENPRQVLRAVQVCLTFALAGASRLSPRDGWVGVGFGRGSQTASAAVQISRQTERFMIEPDIAWINRRWVDLPKYPLESGVSPWSYAFKKASGRFLRANQRTQILHELKRKCDEILANVHDFAAVSAFLDETEAIWRQTVPKNVWTADPHRWWIIRYIPVEANIPDRLNHNLETAYFNARSKLLPQEVVRDTPCPDEDLRRLPYSVRVGTSLPEAVRLVGDEVFNSIVDAAEVRNRPSLHAYLPARTRGDTVPVGKFDNRGLRFLFFDPSPRRSAERFALLLDHAPSYCTSKPQVVALRPPLDCVDNRLVRLSAQEVTIDEVAANATVEFRSSLVTPETASLVAMETISYVHRDLPDLIPVFTDTAERLPLSFGFLDRINRVWLLTQADAISLVNSVRTPDILALIYRLEAHEEIGSPMWLDVIVDGKRTSMPTHSIVAFDMLLHILRTTSGAVAIHVPPTIPAEPVVVDEQQQGIATVAFLRR